TPDAVIVVPHLGVNDARADGVYGDALSRHFLGQALGEADDAKFRRSIVRSVDESITRLSRGGVDQSSLGAAGAKPADSFLAALENALGVDVQVQVPFPLAQILDLRHGDDAGILHRHRKRP